MILTPCFISGLPKVADGTRFLEGSTQVYGVRKLSIFYRVTKINFMGVDYFYPDPTDEGMDDMFKQMSNNSPNGIDGLAIWSTYQFDLMGKGRIFIDAWLASGDDTLFG
ncbi:hypothetical protein [Acetobacter sp.]|uniref:hypothetical protein n=1 Tax=Acetobacter sp. TaxID=440 RepID=UPI0039EBE7DA